DLARHPLGDGEVAAPAAPEERELLGGQEVDAGGDAAPAEVLDEALAAGRRHADRVDERRHVLEIGRRAAHAVDAGQPRVVEPARAPAGGDELRRAPEL